MTNVKCRDNTVLGSKRLAISATV